MNKKYREESLQKLLGRNGNESFTLESILKSPTGGNSDGTDEDRDGRTILYGKIVDFLIGEYIRQKEENLHTSSLSLSPTLKIT